MLRLLSVAATRWRTFAIVDRPLATSSALKHASCRVLVGPRQQPNVAEPSRLFPQVAVFTCHAAEPTAGAPAAASYTSVVLSAP